MGGLLIKHDKSNPISKELLTKVIGKYQNLYVINISEQYKTIDNEIHILFKKLILRSTIIEF